MVTVGLAVPCYGPHIVKLLPLLQSIEAQTRQPDHVVISCSGARYDDIAHLIGDWPFRLDIHTSAQRRNAAQNRNLAARALTTELVSYVDADDTMHPQRLEILAQVFEATGVNIVLHGSLSPPGDEYASPFHQLYPPWPATVNAPGAKHPAGSRFAPVHGHATVTRDLAQSVGQPENLSFERREDSEFIDMLLTKPGVRSAFVDLGLTKYVSSGAWADAPSGSGEYTLSPAATAARTIMNLPLARAFKAPVQAFWRGLPFSIRQRWLK